MRCRAEVCGGENADGVASDNDKVLRLLDATHTDAQAMWVEAVSRVRLHRQEIEAEARALLIDAETLDGGIIDGLVWG